MIRVILTTFSNEADAARVIRQLVEEKLIACGTIVPGARSIYAWEGKIEDTSEAAVFLKTALETAPALERRLASLHPYETPEIIVLNPELVSEKYAHWVVEACKT